MSTKKHAINISIIMIIASLLIIIICWPNRDAGITELLYVLSTGVFGSSFATLWIFVYEYNRTKQELLKAIFDEAVAITENNGLRFLSSFGFHDPGIKESMTGKHYIAPVISDTVENMDKHDKCHYADLTLNDFIELCLCIEPKHRESLCLIARALASHDDTQEK